MLSSQEIKSWLKKNRGVLTTKSARVYRESYFGRNIIAPNKSLADADERGYVPVELWIMSTVLADNPVKKPEEGLTKIELDGQAITLLELKETAGDIIFGDYTDTWPLTKILDIGGGPVETSFGTKETPPIPVHVHAGKSEAYYFPPIDIPPYNKKLSAKTRIGLKAQVTKEDVKSRLSNFGKDDSMYVLLNEFTIEPETSWMVPAGILHAPGPYLTFEVQLPQDDYNLASWRLGERLQGEDRSKRYEELVLRGLKSEDEYIEQVLDWEANIDPNFEKKYFHRPRLLEQGSWGKRSQIFFDMFYGEEWILNPGASAIFPAKEKPQGGVIWSGQGEINGQAVAQGGQNGFLIIPNTAIQVSNTGSGDLYIYTVEPFKRL